MHWYTEEEIQFLRDHVQGRSYAEITELFNARFGLSLSEKAINGTLKRYGLRNGCDGRFQPGQVPHNKGKKGVSYPGMEKTQFQKGHRPRNYRPVGSERINRDGYAEVKVADPKTWRAKHVLVWEGLHGPVPPGCVVIFADGDRLNIDPENLLLVSRRELAVMNKRGLIAADGDLTRAGVTVADVILKIGERKKR